jgi:hypothetical protein
VQIRRDRSALVAEAGGQRLVLVPESDSTFHVQNARVRFVRQPGMVDRLVVETGGSSLPGRRLPASPPVGDELAAYTGDYFSPELETLYRVEADGESLVIRHIRHGAGRLERVDGDLFAGSSWYFGRLEFTRDEAGRIDGFRATGNRVRDLRFVRLADDALPK